VLRALVDRLERQADLTVGVLNHPQSNLGDFYRELAEVFGVSLKPSNHWGGFKTLRKRWVGHLAATRVRCCLLIDEAQEMSPKTLLELRLLASARFDSQPLLAGAGACPMRWRATTRRVKSWGPASTTCSTAPARPT
jgi:general secretion pathway protein A